MNTWIHTTKDVYKTSTKFVYNSTVIHNLDGMNFKYKFVNVLTNIQYKNIWWIIKK